MAQVGRTRLLQLPRGTGEHRQVESISGAGDPPLATGTTLSQPEAPAPSGPNVHSRGTLASRTSRAPSLSRATLRRQSSEIRAVCANERSYGSVRGVPGNWYPYRDRRRISETTSSLRVCGELRPWIPLGDGRWFSRRSGSRVSIQNPVRLKGAPAPSLSMKPYAPSDNQKKR